MDAAFFQHIKDNDFTVPSGYTLDELTPIAAANLASIDSDLRENSLDTLDGWIEKDLYTSEELARLGNQMADSLNRGLGDDGTDTVFCRTFSALILGSIVGRSQMMPSTPHLSESLLRQWLHTSLHYFENEQDLRGFVAEKGWAHGAAHGADLLREFSRCSFLGAPDLLNILNTIRRKLSMPTHHHLVYEEDERIARAVISVFLRNILTPQDISTWLADLVSPPSQITWREAFFSDPDTNRARVHTKSFLRSLLFQLKFGWRNFQNLPYYEQAIHEHDRLIQMIEQSVHSMDATRNYRPSD